MTRLLKFAAVLSVFSLAAILIAQPSGTVTVSPKGLITAESTLPTQPVRCTFQHAYDAIFVNCFVSGVITFQETVEPAISSSIGSQGAFLKFPNIVTWTLKQPSNDVFTWVIGANGFQDSGTFF